MPNLNIKIPIKQEDIPKFAVWDIKENIYYFLNEFAEINFNDTTGEMVIKGFVKAIQHTNKTELESRAKKIKEILKELENYV